MDTSSLTAELLKQLCARDDARDRADAADKRAREIRAVLSGVYAVEQAQRDANKCDSTPDPVPLDP